MFRVIVGAISVVVMVWVLVATVSADDSDFAIHHDVYQDTVNLINLDGYSIEYWGSECILRLGHSYTDSVDTITVRVANAIPAYDILYYPAKITSCVTRD